jgi:quercetin dioxygenase-like cupin family protein
MSSFDDLTAMSVIGVWDGVLARAIEGERCSLAVVELDPDSVVPEHSHPNEQLGMVVRGSISFRIADEERVVGPGATYCIPPNVPHQVHTGPDGAIVLDVFAPAREDWKRLERSDAQTPLWPEQP